MSKSKLNLSIIIPAFNEAENFHRGVLDSVVSYFKKQKYSWEVVLVNDGSTDETLSLLKQFVQKQPGFRVLDIPHGGKVAAVSAGVLDAKGEIILFTDFDQSTPITTVDEVMKKMEQGCDVVIGERQEIKEWSFTQKMRSRIFNLLVQFIALPGIWDTQCGFKAFRYDMAQKLFQNLRVTKESQKGGYMGAFDVELLFLARKLGYLISSISVEWKYYKSTRLRWSEPLKMLRDVIKVRLLDLNQGYQDLTGRKASFWNTHLLALAVLLVLSIPAFINATKVGYFPMHDDLQFARQIIMDKCFEDGQIPCRWSQDLGYGYGFPMFNYYPPLPYYAGHIFREMGLDYIAVIKTMIVINFIVSGWLMYLLAQAFWGRWGGVISGLFYVYAPYHAVDIYARGAINEAWALVWFPGIYWAIYRLIESNKWKYVPLLALFISLLMLSHNPMLMIFAPTAGVWALFWLYKFNRLRQILPKLIAGGVWGFGLAAFFTIPVTLEQKYVHIETLVIGYFNYLAHFATLDQLFLSRFWGYGDSRFGPIDDISFQVGHLHWGFAIIALIAAYLISKKRSTYTWMIWIMVVMTFFYTFLTHERSSFIWSWVKPLEFLQFPWRFLSYSIFGFSFLAGSVSLITWAKNKLIARSVIFILIVVLTIGFYKDYFDWRDHWPWVTDQEKMSGELWRLQTTAGIFDYLPVWAPLPPPDPPNGDAEILTGNGMVKTVVKRSNYQEYQVEVKEPATFQINTFYFPGWRYFVNDEEVQVDPTRDPVVGRPRIDLSPGNYTVLAKFGETPVRLVGDYISLISWVLLIGYFLLQLKPRNSVK